LGVIQKTCHYLTVQSKKIFTMKKIFVLSLAIFPLLSSCQDTENSTVNQPAADSEILYTMPEESEPHEGTWLQWPHEYQYGVAFRNRLDPTWVKMTKALITSEKVHIVVYDDIEKGSYLISD
jgi:agmatine deiminase